VISNGRLVAEGTLAELRDRTGSGQASLEDMFLAIVEQDRAAE
jgi:ABC-2 type transport system ATP-binding protein